MANYPFVQRKTTQELKAGTRPAELVGVDFLGHALYGGVYCVFFAGSNLVGIPQTNPPYFYDFEISTLTLVPGFSSVTYTKDANNNYVLNPSPQITTQPIIYPLLANLLPSSAGPHHFTPTCWHTCDDKDKIFNAGKFGCPRVLFGLNYEIILLRYHGTITVLDINPLMPEFDEHGNVRTPLPVEYDSPYLIPMSLANQHLVYYIVPSANILATLRTWEDNIQNYNNRGVKNLFFEAESPIVFHDHMQMFFCQDVQIHELTSTP